MKSVFAIMKVPTLSPAGLTLWAGLILAVYAVLHLLGWREAATILTGTIPNGTTAEAAGLKAVLYLAAYFAAVLIVPILVLASILSALWLRTWPQESRLP